MENYIAKKINTPFRIHSYLFAYLPAASVKVDIFDSKISSFYHTHTPDEARGQLSTDLVLLCFKGCVLSCPVPSRSRCPVPSHRVRVVPSRPIAFALSRPVPSRLWLKIFFHCRQRLYFFFSSNK